MTSCYLSIFNVEYYFLWFRLSFFFLINFSFEILPVFFLFISFIFPYLLILIYIFFVFSVLHVVEVQVDRAVQTFFFTQTTGHNKKISAEKGIIFLLQCHPQIPSDKLKPAAPTLFFHFHLPNCSTAQKGRGLYHIVACASDAEFSTSTWGSNCSTSPNCASYNFDIVYTSY